jgi:hypothetical protein
LNLMADIMEVSNLKGFTVQNSTNSFYDCFQNATRCRSTEG